MEKVEKKKKIVEKKKEGNDYCREGYGTLFLDTYLDFIYFIFSSIYLFIININI